MHLPDRRHDFFGNEATMIELTHEQWQTVIHEATPTAIDPESKTAYIVVRKDEYDQLCTVRSCEANAAAVLRIAWMRRMGLDEDEIAESLRDDPPASVSAEMKQLKALDDLDKITPPAEVLGKYAIQY